METKNKQEALNNLLVAINSTNVNRPVGNYIMALKYIPEKEVVRVVWSYNPDRNDGYYDINVAGDSAWGMLCDVMNWLYRKL